MFYPAATAAKFPLSVTPPNSWTHQRHSVGPDLRQPWYEVLEITASGALDEFYRKRVRNDYLLL